MNPEVSVGDLFGLLLPRDHPNGWLAMLTAYFDDSGTHDRADVVLVAGLYGTEARLAALDRNWRRHIDAPLCGRKNRIRRFHAYECDNSIGDFSGWTRTETDYFCHQLRTEIIESGVSAYGAACSRKDWDDLITEDIRAVLGTAEGFCIRNVFVKTLEWARENTFDPEMSFVFDSRPSAVARDANVVFHAFQYQAEELRSLPSLVGISFLSSFKIRLLQAADLIAWELYQHANDILVDGLNAPRREQFAHLAHNMDFKAQIARRGSIEQVADQWSKVDKDNLRALAKHFTFFDPAAPDFSHLEGKKPA